MKFIRELCENVEQSEFDELKKMREKDPTLPIPTKKATTKSGYGPVSDSGGAFRRMDENDEELIRMRKEEGKKKKKGLFDF